VGGPSVKNILRKLDAECKWFKARLGSPQGCAKQGSEARRDALLTSSARIAQISEEFGFSRHTRLRMDL